MHKKTEIIIIPSPLGPLDAISEIYSVLREGGEVDLFFVETPKVGREVIKMIYPEKELRQVEVHVIDKNTSEEVISEYIKQIEGKRVVLMSDNGLPGVSDPGRDFIRMAHKANYDVIPVASTSSITTALACSGLNGEQFHYHGYPPRNKQDRIRFLHQIEKESFETGSSQIFIETPYRNVHLWKDILANLNDKTELSISIELLSEKSNIKTARVGDWKKMKWPVLKDRRAVYIVNSHPDVKKAEKKKKRPNRN